MDTTLHAIYDDVSMAQQASQQLKTIGIDQHAIRLVGAAALSANELGHMGSYADSGAHMHDAERDHVGGYADSGAHMHDAERDHMGSYADSGAHMHDAEREQVGSFASVQPARR